MRKIGLAIVVVMVVAAVFGPWLLPIDPSAQDLPKRLMGPTWGHPFGLDELGRDVLARLLSGARISLLVGVFVVSISSSVGVLVGSIAGYAGGWVDELFGRLWMNCSVV
jgi:peptide/nickel transport system permease protein